MIIINVKSVRFKDSIKTQSVYYSYTFWQCKSHICHENVNLTMNQVDTKFASKLSSILAERDILQEMPWYAIPLNIFG